MEHACSATNQSNYIRPRKFASKNPAVSALQDLLFYHLTQIAFFAKNALTYKKTDTETNNKLTRLIYLTNKSINFNINTLIDAIHEAYTLKNREENLYRFLCKNYAVKPKKNTLPFQIQPSDNLAQMVSLANVINVQKSIKTDNINILAMKELIRQSISASANYLEHIKREKNISKMIYANLYDILNFLGSDTNSIKDCKNYALKAGELHTQSVELLISTYEKMYGLIERKKVSTGIKKGNAILVVGEDFSFLKKLLQETENKGINIYTYGILNYAHAFPEINKYKNLVGIYLGKYNNFSSDIENFPGVVVLTSGNLEDLREIFRGRIFSTEDISMLGIKRINKEDLKPLINAAYDAPGFIENKENCYIETGFGLNELSKSSENFYNLIQSNKIKKLLVILGCNYSDEDNVCLKNILKETITKTAIITIDCLLPPLNLKKNNFKEILNMGGYVNIYNLIRLLYSLSGKFRKDINDMPIDIFLNLKGADSIATLLLLLSLEIKNIKIYSDLPNYLTEGIIKIFGKEYNVIKLVKSQCSLKNNITKRA